jgi:hypothetical protein
VTVIVTLRPLMLGRMTKPMLPGPFPDVPAGNWIIAAVPPVTATDQAQLAPVFIEMFPGPPPMENAVGETVAI